MSTDLVTEWVSHPARFAELAGPWEALAARADTPFLGHGWLSAWWAAFADGRPLRTCVLWDRGQLAAAFPLLGRGGRLAALSNDHSPVFHPLGRGPEELAALATAVLEAGGQLEVPALPRDGHELPSLLEAARRAGWRVALEAQRVSPTTATTGDFAAYRDERKARWREIERRGRKLEREHEVEARLVEAPDDLDPQLEEGLRLEASGWKGAAGTAILSSPDTAGFYRSVARHAHERGELRLSGLRVDGRLVAFDLALEARGRYFLLKTAYDETMGRLAPGLVLRRAVIERCFGLGLAAHEFLGDDMEWKRLFSTSERELCLYRGYSRRPVPAMRYGYRTRLRPVLKRVYRAVRPLPITSA